MRTTTFNLRHEPTEGQFRALLAASLTACHTFCVMMQPRKNVGQRATEVLTRLGPFLRRSVNVTEWPGSQALAGYESTLYEYVLGPQVIEIVEGTSLQLYSWMNPDLPEDLHMLRRNGTPWFGSTANEADAWMELTGDEHKQLIATYPELASLLIRVPDEPSAG